MLQSQDIHLNDSKNHRGQTVTTAGQGKHLDVCMRPWQDTPAPAHASLPPKMHATNSLPDACITCTPKLKMYRPPKRTLINHYSIQVPQSAQEKRPYTQTTDPGACSGLGTHISQTQICTRRA